MHFIYLLFYSNFSAASRATRDCSILTRDPPAVDICCVAWERMLQPARPLVLSAHQGPYLYPVPVAALPAQLVIMRWGQHVHCALQDLMRRPQDLRHV